MAGDAQENKHGACLPSIPCIDQDPYAEDQGNAQSQVVLHLFGSHTGDNYLCRPIQARRGLQRQSATAGPLLLLDGTTYQLTVEHVVDFDRHKSGPTWEHTNDDWDDDDDDDTRGFGHVEDMVPSDFGTVRTMSEGSLSSQDSEIDTSSSSSSSSVRELEGNTSWSPVEPASTSRPQSFLEPRTVGHIAVKDFSSSSQIELSSSPTRCHISKKLDYLLFPIHVSPDPELCTTRGAEMVQPSDVFDVYGQAKVRPAIITTASLGYVRGIISPASTLLQKPGSRSFQTLFCIESAFPMPKGTSGSAVFDAQTGLLAGYLVLGCPGKCTCYMVPMCDVLAELNTLSSSAFQCQVRLDVSAIVEVYPERSTIARFSFHAGGHSRSVPLPSIALREEAIKHNNQPVLGDPPAYLPGVFPNPTDHDEKHVKRKKSPRNPRKFKPNNRYAIRVTSATLEWVREPADEWKERFGRTTKLWCSSENRPFIHNVWETMPEPSELIQTFCYPSIITARSERVVSRIERFCEGASSALDRFIPDPTFGGAQEPRAWVSDRNQAPEGLSSPQRAYGKRFPDHTNDKTVGHCRRIYIDNPNGSSVLALMRTAPSSQVEGFRQLFADYITPTPEPKIILRESDWWMGCFVFSFNLPFFGIQSQEDLGNISSNGKRQFRCCRNLSFLNLNRGTSESPRNDESTFPYPAFLHEAVWSFMVTGKSDRYWTAVFFDEDLFDEDPRLDEDLLETYEDLDPIILQAATKSMTTSPRSYALAALETALYRIVEHHANIQDWFRAGFELQVSAIRQDSPTETSPEDIQKWMGKFRDALEHVINRNSSLILKLDQFLSEDVMFGPDALPRGILWRNLQSDADSLRSLLRIKQYRNKLGDIESEFRLLLQKAEEEVCNL
ncbi:hypothetical protein CEP54_014822 [Fusarium duplospermum]|uniref:Uncharacterized protein n=1 Tax=Fusarium duplospermum TaxID=1325734 RepID=A0A428NTP8_9HYPO|nr:hypothetical protein CEP54_014822 [Fusarium duplospermum]